MVLLGIISDTHVTDKDDPNKIKSLLEHIRQVFKNVDEIIHAGDVCEEFFLIKLGKIAPTKCVAGHLDKFGNLEKFLKFSIGRYNIGVIHEPPENFEDFFKSEGLHILIHGHTHICKIEGTKFNTLILNPGSPTQPNPPPQKLGFKKPIARPSIITLEIDEADILKTYIINLKFQYYNLND